MPGFVSSVSNNNEAVFANNADFSGSTDPTELNGLRTNGQLWIGSTATNVGGTHVNVGEITSPMGTLTIGYSSPNITIDVAGGSSGITYTPDEGGVISPVGNLNVNGDESGTSTTPVLTTHNVAGNLVIEPRAYSTPYVVDSSSTIGERGTYQTVQSAMDAAVTDGMAYNNQKMIYIRTGTYTENLVIPPGAILVGETLSFLGASPITITQSTLIIGSHTFSNGNSVCGFNNIIFQTATGITFDLTSSIIALLYFDNCTLFQVGSDAIVDNAPGGSYISVVNTALSGTGDLLVFNLQNGACNLYMNGCKFKQPMNISISGGSLTCSNTTGIGHVELTDGSTITALSCTFDLGGAHNYNIDASVSGSTGTFTSCFFNTADIAGISAFASGSDWVIHNCATGASGVPLYSNSALVNSYGVSDQGNLIKSFRTAITLNMTTRFYYVGVTDTSSARTINLPASPSSPLPQKDQTFIIKDESGAAGTNNITVSTIAGTVTIDGATTKVINTNYGVLKVIFDGTNYFTI